MFEIFGEGGKGSATQRIRTAARWTAETLPDYWATTVASRQPGGTGSVFEHPYDIFEDEFVQMDHPEIGGPATGFRSTRKYPASLGVTPLYEVQGRITLSRPKGRGVTEEFATMWELTAPDTGEVSDEYVWVITGPVENKETGETREGVWTFHPGEPSGRYAPVIDEKDIEVLLSLAGMDSDLALGEESFDVPAWVFDDDDFDFSDKVVKREGGRVENPDDLGSLRYALDRLEGERDVCRARLARAQSEYGRNEPFYRASIQAGMPDQLAGYAAREAAAVEERARRRIREINREIEDLELRIRVAQRLQEDRKHNPPWQLPEASPDTQWDEDAAVERIEKLARRSRRPWKVLGEAFLVSYADDSNDINDYALPIADVRGGRLIVIPEALNEAERSLDELDERARYQAEYMLRQIRQRSL